MHRDGILLIDKPAGVTSFKVVDHVRRQLVRAFPQLDSRLGKRRPGAPKPPRFKCGHAGTLDPLATGLLVVLVGKGSRLSPFLMGLDKSYAATVRFGAATDTLDREGQVVDTAPVPGDPAVLESVLPGFRGEIMQVPPLISALKKDGKALYKRVRSGEDVEEPEARPVTVSRLEVTATRWGIEMEGMPTYEADLVIDCGSGTYIRSLARDLAVACGTVGHIHQLRRLSVGPFGVDDSVPGVLDMNGQELAAAMRPLTEALPQVPSLPVDQEEAAALRQGTQPPPEWLDRLDGVPVACGKASGPIFRMLDGEGQLVAVGELDPGTGFPSLAVVIPAEPNNDGDPTCA